MPPYGSDVSSGTLGHEHHLEGQGRRHALVWHQPPTELNLAERLPLGARALLNPSSMLSSQ